MSRHWLSSICLGLAIVAGMGTSRAPVELNARITRSDQAVIILNDDEFEWRTIDVEIRDPDDPNRNWRIPVEALGPGESIRVPFEHISGTAPQASDLLRMPRAELAVFADEVENSFGYTSWLKLSEIPRERSVDRREIQPPADEEPH